MSSWCSPQSIYALGHRATQHLLGATVIVQEKADGSFFQFGIIDGELKFRSKGQEFDASYAPAMFMPAVNKVLEVQHLLVPGLTYRGETLSKPKHNALQYSRVPMGHIILFDILEGEESYLAPSAVERHAKQLGLDAVPTFYSGPCPSYKELEKFLELESALGGPKIEGVVIKAYDLFGPDKKALFGKLVSAEFKEVHRKAWGSGSEHRNTKGGVLETLKQRYRTEARWRKAMQHLNEAGKLELRPQDIGPLIKEVQADILKECEEEIARALVKWAMPEILRASTAGLPEFYKEYLMKEIMKIEVTEEGDKVEL